MVHIAHKSSLLQSCTRKTRLLDVVYNASNNELVSLSAFLAARGPSEDCAVRASRYCHGFECYLYLQVRTQTLVKNAIVLVDATPFKQFYQQHYGIELGTKKKVAAGLLDVEQKEKEEEQSHSSHVNRKHKLRLKSHKLDPAVSFPPQILKPAT